MSLTEAQAQARIERLTDYNTDPTLGTADISDLLEVAARPDESGYVRSDGTATWTATWDLNAAAAEGWRRKAGKAATRYNFSEDGQSFTRAQIYAHCLSQAEHYASKTLGSFVAHGGTITPS